LAKEVEIDRIPALLGFERNTKVDGREVEDLLLSLLG
jgi:hypothetical protein